MLDIPFQIKYNYLNKDCMKVKTMDINFMSDAVNILSTRLDERNHIDPLFYEKYNVKRGLRNADGSGVLAGLSNVCSVRGYMMNDAEKFPIDGQLLYRGYDIKDLVTNCEKENRFAYEEVCWLLIFGTLPTEKQLSVFKSTLGELRELPEYFAEDMILKAPSHNIMNKLARSVLALYSNDDNPDDISTVNILRQILEIIARLPTILAYSYQAKRRHYDKKSMYFHPIDPKHSTAEMILSSIRADRQFTAEEAKLLDICLTLHAEHGGGNNSTFSARVLASSGTDTYAVISSAIGSLKGPRHGGANAKFADMLDHIEENVKDWHNDDEIASYLERIVKREVGDKSGLVYGMGHAVYTKSDPRAVILKKYAKKLCEEKGFGDEFELLERIERLTPEVFHRVKGSDKTLCANIDFYSGIVYKTLGIPRELFTPLFAVARCAGWSAHRIEETMTGKRIIRPAYKSTFSHELSYIPMADRDKFYGKD